MWAKITCLLAKLVAKNYFLLVSVSDKQVFTVQVVPNKTKYDGFILCSLYCDGWSRFYIY